jgi:hypothetical protein
MIFPFWILLESKDLKGKEKQKPMETR